jgi:hypothetical protein
MFCASDPRNLSSALIPQILALSPPPLSIWRAQNPFTWPPRSLAAISGLMRPARNIDNTGIAIVESQDGATVGPVSTNQQRDAI